jgi:glycosyltransferase involved in cell wall biosynthesis
LEAQAAGTPVIALGKGGALDTVVEGKTGTFFAEQTVEALQQAIARFETMRLDPEAIREHARQFSEERFATAMREAVEGAMKIKR